MEQQTAAGVPAAEQPDVIRSAEAIAQLALVVSGRPELAALVPTIGGLARMLDGHFRGRGIDPGPLPALADDLDRLASGGIEEIDAWRRAHGLV